MYKLTLVFLFIFFHSAFVSGQNTVVKIMKGGNVLTSYNLSEIDSVVFEKESDFLTDYYANETEESLAKRLLYGRIFVIDSMAKGNLGNTWYESVPNGKTTSKCYDDEYVFDADSAFHCYTHGAAYGNPGAKSALSRFPALSFGGDESQYDMFINVDESARAPYTFQVKKMKDNAQDPKSAESFYIKLSSDEAHLGYFDEMLNNPNGRYYKIMPDQDANNNTITLQSYAYNSDGSVNHFSQCKLIVKGYVRPEPRKPNGVYDLKETFEGDFKTDYNYAGIDTLLYDVAGSKYLFNPSVADATSSYVSIVKDPLGSINKVAKVTRGAAERFGFLYAPYLPKALDASKGLVVSVRVFIPLTNVYVWNGNKEGWAWDPTGKPVSEFVNLRVRVEHPNLDGGAWQTRVEKDVNLSDFQGQWITVVFHMTKSLQESTSLKREFGYQSVGFMFGREGYEHTEALEIYYDDIVITTPDKYNEVSLLKSLSKVIDVY